MVFLIILPNVIYGYFKLIHLMSFKVIFGYSPLRYYKLLYHWLLWTIVSYSTLSYYKLFLFNPPYDVHSYFILCYFWYSNLFFILLCHSTLGYY